MFKASLVLTVLAAVLLVVGVANEASKNNLSVDERVAALQSRLDKIEQLAAAQRAEHAEATATFIKHVRESHMPPLSTELFDALEWPDGWRKLELVCPEMKYSKRCRTTEYFKIHPYEEPK